MQDGQSIECYLFDTLLMRQQIISTHEQYTFCGVVRSRMGTLKRLLDEHLLLERSNGTNPKCIASKFCVQVMESEENMLVGNLEVNNDIKSLTDCENTNIENKETQSNYANTLEFDQSLPSETWYDKFCSFTSIVLGRLYSIIIYWVGAGALLINAGNSPPFTGQTQGTIQLWQSSVITGSCT